MIPQKVLDFIRKTVDGSHPLSDGIVEKEENVSSIIESLVSGHTVDGSGVATKRVIKGISNKDAGKDKTVIEFAISDGENSADCVIHNTAAKYLNGGIADKDLASFDAMIRKSVSEGKPLKVEGCYTNFNRKRVFVVETMEWADDGHESQLDAKQVAEFLKICNAEGVTPLDLMLDNDGLWSEIYADEELKKAVLLFCLSPFEKEDMIHFGLITNPGEGKNHLVDKVISPLVRCRMAATGKLSTFAAIFGAMSSDDLSSIELGLLPKMHHDRIVFSEFQTMEEDVFGEMLNVMSDGHYNLQKGKMDVTRHAMLNMGFFGNPPNYWTEDQHDKQEMLAAFGKYTLPIVSRLTIIFAKPTLNSDPNAEKKIRRKILDNMDKKAKKAGKTATIDNLRKFFREYLLYVSKLQPELGLYAAIIESEFERIESTDNFKEAFAKRGKTDNRKWAGLLSLIRGFARLHGREKLEMKDIQLGLDIFQESLETLTASFPRASLSQGIDYELLELHRSMISTFDKGMGNAIVEMKSTLRDFAKKQGRVKQFDELFKITLDDGSKLIEDMGKGEILVKKNWEGSN